MIWQFSFRTCGLPPSPDSNTQRSGSRSMFEILFRIGDNPMNERDIKTRSEELQQLSDDKLNRMAAVQILWGGIVNVPSEDWKPCTDMNDAMRLVNILRDDYDVQIRSSISGWTAVFSSSKKPFYTQHNDKELSRAITIAAISAKVSVK